MDFDKILYWGSTLKAVVKISFWFISVTYNPHSLWSSNQTLLISSRTAHYTQKLYMPSVLYKSQLLVHLFSCFFLYLHWFKLCFKEKIFKWAQTSPRMLLYKTQHVRWLMQKVLSNEVRWQNVVYNAPKSNFLWGSLVSEDFNMARSGIVSVE
jgi:hypothetical protein